MLFDTFNELDRIGSAFFSGFPAPSLARAPMNLYREDDRYVVETDLPGFDPSSIDVSVDGGLLTIRADRAAEAENRSARWIVRERDAASVVRQLALGEDVDLDAISADYRDGVLTVTLPVRADALPKKVQVAVEGARPVQRAVEAAVPAARQEVSAPKAEPAHSAGS